MHDLLDKLMAVRIKLEMRDLIDDSLMVLSSEEIDQMMIEADIIIAELTKIADVRTKYREVII